MSRKDDSDQLDDLLADLGLELRGADTLVGGQDPVEIGAHPAADLDHLYNQLTG